jgi:protein involved in polysaccharide export with SLBB domain
MSHPRLLVVLAALAAALTATSCTDPPPSKYPPQKIALEDTTLGPGDVFEVRVYRQEELTGTYEVSPECTVTYPLLGPITVCGKTPSDIGRTIQTGLADGYLKSPQVSVLVTEYRSKKISVFGQVKKPGTLAYAAGMTVVEAISQAGGFTEMARKNATTVTRSIEGEKARYTIPVEAIGEGRANNFIVRPGDVVFVPRRTF